LIRLKKKPFERIRLVLLIGKLFGQNCKQARVACFSCENGKNVCLSIASFVFWKEVFFETLTFLFSQRRLFWLDLFLKNNLHKNESPPFGKLFQKEISKSFVLQEPKKSSKPKQKKPWTSKNVTQKFYPIKHCSKNLLWSGFFRTVCRQGVNNLGSKLKVSW
jgi:hypothetical protein